MTTYSIMSVSKEENDKANKDWSYSPQEYQVGTIQAETERQAFNKLARMIKKGKAPLGAQLRLNYDEW